MNKLNNDKGQVAVLYSPRFGAGWSTWASADIAEQVIFDGDIAKLVIEKESLHKEGNSNLHKSPEFDSIVSKIEKLSLEKFGEDFYPGGAADLALVWVDAGVQFKIYEYDGKESIEFAAKEIWIIA